MRRFAFALLLLAIAAPAAAQQACPTPWALEDLDLGPLGKPGNVGSMFDLTLDARGNRYLAGGTPWIPSFDSTGARIRDIGQSDDGKGVFGSTISRIGWKGDTLWAREWAGTSGKLVFLSTNGFPFTEVSFSIPAPEEGALIGPGKPLADGSVLGERGFMNAGRQADFEAIWAAYMRTNYETQRLPLRRFSRDGRLLDTIAMVDLGRFRSVGVLKDGRTQYYPHPLVTWSGEDGLPATLARDGASVLLIRDRQPGTFDLVRIGVRGDTLLQRAIQYEPRRIGPLEQASLREWFGTIASRGYQGASDYAQSLREADKNEAMKGVRFPEFFPPVRRILAGDDGSIWILRELRADRGDLWEIYDAQGRLEGSVLVPDAPLPPAALPWGLRLEPLRATRDELWGVTRADKAGAQLHRYRVKRTC